MLHQHSYETVVNKGIKTAFRLIGALAIVAIAVLALPLVDISRSHSGSLLSYKEKALADSPTDVVDQQEHDGSVPGQDIYEVNPSAPGASLSHANRVAPWVSSPLSGPLGNPPIYNFGVVEDGMVYRSAQPTDADYLWLLNNGFKSIVSFRKETGATADDVLKLGFSNYLWLNVEDETNPSDEQAERFLDFVTDSRNWPVLIHCKVGLGRTGTMAALIRYAVDGWSMSEAIKEARLYRNGVDLVQSQLDWLARWAMNHPPGCHRPVPLGG